MFSKNKLKKYNADITSISSVNNPKNNSIIFSLDIDKHIDLLNIKNCLIIINKNYKNKKVKILKKNNSVKLIGNPNKRGGVLSFTVEGVHPHDIATILDETGVAIRAGHHCCQILHDKLNIPASARASIGVYNTKDDLDQLNESINKCKKIFNL